MHLYHSLRTWWQLRRSRRQQDSPTRQRSGGQALSWLAGLDQEPAEGAALVHAQAQSVWIYSCVSAIAEQVAHIPFVFARDGLGGEQRVAEGDAVRLFNHPGEEMDRFVFWELVCQWLLLRGRCYLVALDRDGAVLPVHAPGRTRRKPARLALLNPDRLRRHRAGHALQGYRYQPGPDDPLGSETFLSEEVIAMRMPCAGHHDASLAPLGVAWLAAQTDYAAAQFMKGLMLNNADHGLIITTKEQMTDQQIACFQAALRERKRRAGLADRPLFLTQGARVETPELSMADLQFLENRKFSRQEICAVFHVPQEILGFTEDANRAVAESVRLGFIENRIAPLCERLQSALDPVVKLFDPRLWGFFDLDSLPLLQAARRKRFESARQGFEMGIPLAVLNRVFDLGLPALPHDKRSYLPAALQEVAELPAPSRALISLETGEVPAAERALSLAESGVERLTRLVSGHLAQDAGPGEHECLGCPGHCGPVEVRYSPVLRLQARALQRKLSRYFFEQRGRVLARLETWRVAPEGGPLLELPHENARLMALLQPLLIGLLETATRDCLRHPGAAAPRLHPAEAAGYLEQRQAALNRLNDETERALRDSLRAGLALQEPAAALATRVRQLFQRAGDRRARAAAELEAAAAFAHGRGLAALQTADK